MGEGGMFEEGWNGAGRFSVVVKESTRYDFVECFSVCVCVCVCARAFLFLHSIAVAFLGNYCFRVSVRPVCVTLCFHTGRPRAPMCSSESAVGEV